MVLRRRGAETGSGFQEAINRTNEAYERAGRACITRKAIPGKYLVARTERRRGLSIPSIELNDSSQARLAASDLSRMAKAGRADDWRKFIPESKAEPDYGGTIGPDGRAIFYDAKTTRRNALDFDNLHAHQIGFLERMGALGAVAGFLVEFHKWGEVYFLPVQALARWRDEQSRKSLPHRFFAAHLIPARAGKGLLIYDYLAAIAEQEQRYGRDYRKFVLTAQ
jgi:penicillin-binding protein-related factor A (putative recombinase)